MTTSQDYASITEGPGQKATDEQLRRIVQRYRFARDHAAGGRILEVACGTGIGLDYLAAAAREVAGVDIDPKNVAMARAVVGADGNRTPGRVAVEEMDAHHLKYPDASFDLVLLFEAIYYLRDPERFVSEAARVLDRGGRLIIGCVNRAWPDCHPSPFSHRYYTAAELKQLLATRFPRVNLYAGFPTSDAGFRARVVSLLKRAGIRFHLIPGSLAARAYLKRIFIGQLADLPSQVTDGLAPYDAPVPIQADEPLEHFKVIYAVAAKQGEGAIS